MPSVNNKVPFLAPIIVAAHEEKLQHFTIRPSGTGNALRFHIQLHDDSVTESNLIEKKEKQLYKGKAIMDSIRELLKAPRT